MEQLKIPEGYTSPLTIRETEVAIKEVKDHFERALNRSDYEAAKKSVEELCSILGEEHSEGKNAKEELNLNYWVEEN